MNEEITLTKIIATLGPASSSEEVISRLIVEGVDVFRINFSHGKLEDYEALLNKVRAAGRKLGMPVAVLGDLPGPKIRLGEVCPEGIELFPGQLVYFTELNKQATADEPVIFSTNYPKLLDEVKPGERMLIDDGAVQLVCKEKEVMADGIRITAVVTEGGRVSSRKGLNLPDSELSLPSLTDRDRELTRFAVEKGFDFLALSFVRSGKDIRELKELLGELGARPGEPRYHSVSHSDITIMEGTYKGFIPIISKIEKPQAVRDLEEILKETDMVMVARGDLGVEMDLAEVAVIQKQIIASCREFGIPVIVATQMLQSMIDSATPTRAEVSDVANAIFDGADAVMLSGETAVGKHPVESVRTMNRISLKTNEYIRKTSHSFSIPGKMKELRYRSAAMAHGVKTIVDETDVDFIGVWSELGGSAVFLSQCRIPQPIYAFSPDERTVRLLTILYGVQPVLMEKPTDSTEFMSRADGIALERKWAKKGDTAVYISREPISQLGLTNMVNLHYIGEER